METTGPPSLQPEAVVSPLERPFTGTLHKMDAVHSRGVRKQTHKTHTRKKLKTKNQNILVHKMCAWSSSCGSAGYKYAIVSMRMQVWSLASLNGLWIQHHCELWCRPAAAAPIRHLVCEPPYAAGVALKRQK